MGGLEAEELGVGVYIALRHSALLKEKITFSPPSSFFFFKFKFNFAIYFPLNLNTSPVGVVYC